MILNYALLPTKFLLETFEVPAPKCVKNVFEVTTAVVVCRFNGKVVL